MLAYPNDRCITIKEEEHKRVNGEYQKGVCVCVCQGQRDRTREEPKKRQMASSDVDRNIAMGDLWRQRHTTVIRT